VLLSTTAIAVACGGDSSETSAAAVAGASANVTVGMAKSYSIGPGQSDDSPTAAAVDRKGGSVVVGTATHRATPGRQEQDIAILRLRRSGKPDRRFGDQGRVVSSFKALHDESAVAVDIDGQGRVVVAAQIDMTPINSGSDARDRVLVARYLPDGKVDPTFGRGGRIIVGTPGDIDELYAVGIRVRPSGQIVVAGNDGYGLYVLQLTKTGKRDNGFGPKGLARGPRALSLYMYSYGLTLDEAGLPVVLGYFSPADSNRSCALAKFNSDGRLASFGKDGWFASEVLRKPRLALCTAAVPTGASLLAFGSSTTRDDSENGVIFRELPSTAKLGPEGQLDAGYGDGGIASAKDPDPTKGGSLSHGASPLGLVLGPSGASVGISTIERTGQYVLTTFGPSGSVGASQRVGALGPKTATTCAATSATGRILICGTRRGTARGNDFAVALGQM
jgi:uncharacterized delta-60 repeat protein